MNKNVKISSTILLLFIISFFSPVVLAAPQGGEIEAGTAEINYQEKLTEINQSSEKTVINWQQFSIAGDEVVNFNQPGKNAIALNRIIGSERSIIDGALNADGQVWLLNSSGILFGKNARVNTAGLLAATGDLSDEDFMAGNYKFRGESQNPVINKGEIEISDSGYAALLGKEIINEGVIKAELGEVHLRGGKEFRVDLNGNSLINLTVTEGQLNALVENRQAIIADGGEVYLTTNAVDELFKSAVNNEGIVEAGTIDDVSGESQAGRIEIFAHGGTASIDGKLITGEGEGFIETSGEEFVISENAEITGGHWLLDPVNVTIDDTLAGTIKASLGSGDVTINTDGDGSSDIDISGGESGSDGDIIVNSEITWSAATKLTLAAYRDIYINKSITAENAAGQLALLYGQGAVNEGNTADYYVNAPINLKAGQNFITRLGSDVPETVWTVITDLGSEGDVSRQVENSLQGMGYAPNLGNNYVLGTDIDAGETGSWNNGQGWNPVGDGDGIGFEFTGSFAGLGHKISDLTVNRPGVSYTGLFGAVDGGVIRSIGLENISVNGADYAGGLTGEALNTVITGSYVTGIVAGGDYVGGLIGKTNNITITKSYTGGSAVGNNYVGGLTGSISSTTIKNSYSHSSVSGGSYVGGLVGYAGDSDIYYSFAYGKVQGDSDKGGLLGYNLSMPDGLGSSTPTTTVSSSYFDKTVNSGMDDASYGKTTSELKDSLIYYSWDKNIWSFGKGETIEGYGISLPYLRNITAEADIPEQEILFAGGWGGLTEAAEGITGANGSAYSIKDWDHLANIRKVSAKGYTFELRNDLDAETDGYNTNVVQPDGTYANNGRGWMPIGYSRNKFTGSFNGLDHIISDLKIDGSSTVGLFGTAEQAVIKNLIINNASVKGNFEVGALMGSLIETHIENVHTDEQTEVEGEMGVGGLVGTTGFALRTILNSSSAGTVKGYSDVGGLVGRVHDSRIENSYSTADVIYTERITVGGLAAPSPHSFGGLVGSLQNSTITDSYARGTVDAAGVVTVGGLVGMASESTIEKSYTDNEITGSENVGGLVGLMTKRSTDIQPDTLKNSYALGSVTGDNKVGGLVGTLVNETIKNSYSAAEVNSTGEDVGGLIGFAPETIEVIVVFIPSEPVPVENEIIASYYDRTINPGMNDEADYGRTTEELQDIDTFKEAGWDIVEDSSLEDGYPVFSDSGSIWRISPDIIKLTYSLDDITAGEYTGSPYYLSDLYASEVIFGTEYAGLQPGTDYIFKYRGNKVTGFKKIGKYSGVSVSFTNKNYTAADSGNRRGTVYILPDRTVKDVTSDTGTTGGRNIFGPGFNIIPVPAFTMTTDQFVQIVNGGINLPTGLGQLFFTDEE